MTIAAILLASVSLIGLFYVASVFNRLVIARNRYRNAYAQIDVQLQRRHDLIPNLVETARAYLKHEHATLEAVISARNTAATAANRAASAPGETAIMRELASAESALNGTLTRLFAVAEAYPQLKADVTMARLMEELSSTENKVAFARQSFNDSIMDYNTSRETFPANVVSGMFGFSDAGSFEVATSDARTAPKVQF